MIEDLRLKITAKTPFPPPRNTLERRIWERDVEIDYLTLELSKHKSRTKSCFCMLIVLAVLLGLSMAYISIVIFGGAK
jgi:hypothetical protein